MKKKHKAIWKWICGAVAALLIVLVVGAWAMFGPLITAANSIEKLEDNLYSMEYDGDYGFDDFLAQGGAASDGELANYLVTFLSRGFYKIESDVQTGEFGCSTICVQDAQGCTFFGRNYDWAECRAMIVHTRPRDGYESVSTCCLDFLGFGENYVPNGSMMERMQSLAAIYVPMDGMNEKGLVVADLMAGDDEETHQRSDKPDLTTTTAIRLLLDRAADVDEAVALLGQYDMNSSIGSAHHLSIADASGRSVVVEYVNGDRGERINNQLLSSNLTKFCIDPFLWSSTVFCMKSVCPNKALKFFPQIRCQAIQNHCFFLEVLLQFGVITYFINGHQIDM